MSKTVFETLSAIDCAEHIEKKNGLSYLSWAWAWQIVKKNYPDASYSHTTFDGKPFFFDEDLGYLVETIVTIQGETLSMQLPVMDGANKAQKNKPYTYKTKFGDKSVEQATMFDINTAKMRCLVKNLAMFGLGLYIYAGEDIPPAIDRTPALKEKLNKCSTVEELKLLKLEYAKEFQDTSIKNISTVVYNKITAKTDEQA